MDAPNDPQERNDVMGVLSYKKVRWTKVFYRLKEGMLPEPALIKYIKIPHASTWIEVDHTIRYCRKMYEDFKHILMIDLWIVHLEFEWMTKVKYDK